jgi:hypothetical protein
LSVVHQCTTVLAAKQICNLPPLADAMASSAYLRVEVEVATLSPTQSGGSLCPPRHPFTNAHRQQTLWLAGALVQADLPSYIADAVTWMTSEQAIVADFCRNDTIAELGKALKLTNAQVQRLRSKIDALSPDSIPLPGIEVSLRDKSPDVDDDEIVSWRPPSPSRPDQNRAPAPPLHSGATSATARPSTPSKRTELRLCSIHGKMRDPEKPYQLSNGNFSCNKKHECITGPPPNHDRKGRGPLAQSTASPCRLLAPAS